MKIGFIGAGRVGFTLGKYLKINGQSVTGYFSRDPNHAKEAAEFTDTLYYNDVSKLILDSDVLFLTVSDNAIATVFEELKQYDLSGKLLNGKILCHTSGAMSSEVFTDSKKLGIYGYSIHPIYSFSDKLESYKKLNTAFVTLEGDEKYLSFFENLFSGCGNKTAVIKKETKSKYHAAAVFASNFCCGIIEEAVKLLSECGFKREEAFEALKGLFIGQSSNIETYGYVKALTGPIDRNDTQTVEKHLAVLEGEDRLLYSLLAKRVIDVAREKNKDTDYTGLQSLIDEVPKKGGKLL